MIEVVDIKKRERIRRRCSFPTTSSTVFAVDDSRVTITNDDSEKGENRRPGHDVNVGVTAHVSSHRSDT